MLSSGMMKTINVSSVFQKTWQTKDIRIIAHQGGARSSKTYSICQYLIVRALCGDNITCTIARASYTWLKTSAMADFMSLLNDYGLYNESDHNNTNHTYSLNGSVFSFIGLDESQKLRGRKQDVFWINEANECTIDNFRQAILRTSQQVIVDYNPSANHHWIYEHVLTRPDCVMLHSTYRNNPFIPAELTHEIELLKSADDNYWRVFGLGERGASPEMVFPKYDLFHTLPRKTTTAYGLDFGFTHPTALIRADYCDGDLYLTELIYQSYLTIPTLIGLIKKLNLIINTPIWADYSRPENIKELNDAGIPARPATKHVAEGVEHIKRCRLFINANSKNLINEVNNYRWKKDMQGNILEVPVKELDDAIDAARYASYHIVAPKRGIQRATVIGNRK